MNITLCGSFAFFKQMETIKTQLEESGHNVKMPELAEVDVQADPLKNNTSLKAEAMHEHFKKIEWADAILVVNEEKKEISGYIGANTLIEMGVAFYLNKSIYLLNEVPNIGSREEILGMCPFILEGDIMLLRN